MDTKQKNRNSACAFLRFYEKKPRITALFREINNGAAAVKHKNQGDYKEQSHEDV